MKIYKFILLFFVLSTAFAYSQDKMHEVRVSYGIGTTSEIIDAFSDILMSGLSGKKYTKNTNYSGAIILGYKYKLNKRVRLGGTFTYEKSDAKAYSDKVYVGKFNRNYYTIAAEADFNYFSSKYVDIYGSLGLGGTLYHEKYTSEDNEKDNNEIFHINYQVTPIGIKLGKNIGAFAELGVGYKGIISAGAFARF